MIVEVGGRTALAEWDTKALFKEFATRVNPRALGGAVLAGVGLGVTLSVAYLAGGAARSATVDAPAVRVAITTPVAKSSFDGPARAAVTATPVSLRGSAPEPAAPQLDRPHGVGSLDCLTAAVYYEARGESDRGQQAVAQVVLNRVRRAGFPKSVCGVVFQGAASHECQFSFACDGSMHQGRETAAWRRARAVAQSALDGVVMEEVGEATNFHVASLGRIWGTGLVKVAQVGAHVFYKLTNHGTIAVHDGGQAHPGEPAPPETAIPADGVGAQPNLILASAVGMKSLGQGGPAGPVSEPASAPVATAPAPSAAKATSPTAKAAPAAPAAAVSTAPKAES